MMVALGVVAGLGAGAIDAGLNTYVASHFGEGLMQWLHASYGIGVTLGPIIMTVGLNQFHTWRVGYAVVGTAQLALAASFVLTLSRWQSKDDPASAERPRRLTDYKTSLRATLRRPPVWLSLLIFFVYTGAEVMLGSWTYSLLTESRGIAPQVAGFWAGSYWASFTIGRLIAGLYMRRIGLHTLIRGSLLAALVGAVLLWWNPMGVTSLLGVAIVGFAIAPIFPGLVSGTSARVGPRYAANTIGMQIGAAGLGGAIIPGLAGVLARYTSLEVIPLCLVAAILLLLALYSFAMRPSAAGADGKEPLAPGFVPERNEDRAGGPTQHT
jgi:fucose permease